MSAHITVGYNASASSMSAVFWAAGEAAARAVELRIVSSRTGPSSGDAFVAGPDFEALVEGDVEPIEAICQSVRLAHPGLSVTTEVRSDTVHDALIGADDRPELVVVGSSHHEGPAGSWFESTALWLTRHSPCPVVVVRRHELNERPLRIVVGVDGSAQSDVALGWAAAEADLHRVELVVVHGWDAPYQGVDLASRQARDLREVDAACIIDRAVEAARELSGTEVSGLVVSQRPLAGLLETTRPGDLLVVGSRGRSAIASAVLGSTSKSLLDRSPVPVVVVRGHPET